jgi:predicted PurR-regulated permease PerM
MTHPSSLHALEQRVFLWFVVIVSLAMAWIALPFFSAILWGIVATIVFWPFHRRLVATMPKRKNIAATITLTLIVAVVIIPALGVGSLLIEQAINVYQSLQNRQIDIGKILANLQAGLPSSLMNALDRLGFGDVTSIENKLVNVANDAARLAAQQAVQFGQGAFNFAVSLSVMLYLTYFLLRDGGTITRRIGERIPLADAQRRDLFDKFATVVRATVKGSIVVAIVQGLVGGTVFALIGVPGALLWGVVMGVFALVPAVGTGIIWVPMTIYLLATGSLWQGAVLGVAGFFVIGSVDNVLRPWLVGADTRMPDYVVLISTLGGISVFGFGGIVVGPMIAALFIAAWDSFLEQRKSFAREALEGDGEK